MRAALLALLLLTACTKDRQPEARSTSFKTAKERIAFLRDYVACPGEPKDAVWHVFPVDEGTVVHAVVKVDPADVHLWSMGCGNFGHEARPKWLGELLKPTGWKVSTIPDTWSCGFEKRVIHVKEGIVIRSALLKAD